MSKQAKESQFQAKVIKFLKELPNTWYVKIWGGGFMKSGIPDILCCINGKFVALELKREGGIASELQKRNVRLINESNGIALILYPRDFEFFKLMCKELLQNETDMC